VPSKIYSFYSYKSCALSFIQLDGSIECPITTPALMDVLKITPPFFYSYQCASTLLTSYLPVHMYSISLQVVSTIVMLIIIFTSNLTQQHPRWLLSLFPGVCWPSHWQRVVSICLHLCSWLVLIGRFVSVRLDALRALRSSSPSKTDAGLLVFLSLHPTDCRRTE
jgi:hypothetical protein